jgi:hypothetical protein
VFYYGGIPGFLIRQNKREMRKARISLLKNQRSLSFKLNAPARRGIRQAVLWLQLVSGLLPSLVFLPLVVQPAPQADRTNFYGLALVSQPASDLRLLGATWFYTWGTVNPYPYAPGEFVPMLREMLAEIYLPSSYNGTILVGNEPGNPSQTDLSPTEAVNRLNIIRQQYPHARLLCCGTLSYNIDWLRQFVAAGGKPDGWHFHAYVESPYSVADITGQLAEMHQITGGFAWITEYSVLGGDASQFTELTIWMEGQNWIERIAPYTNRQPHTGAAWELDPSVELVNADGSLTPLGEAYVSR